MFRVAQITASRFFGGPERQMIELAGQLPAGVDTTFVSFAEDDSCREFLSQANEAGFGTHQLVYDMPSLFSARNELHAWLRENAIDLLCCEGYKPNILGQSAARLAGIPVMSISRGWTSETWKVRLYEMLDKVFLRQMDHVVCVSHEQARRVRATGIDANKVSVIHNAIRTSRFAAPSSSARQEMIDLFATEPRWLVAAAGRLSPEKGFDVLVEAADTVISQNNDVGFVVFGDGRLKDKLQHEIKKRNIQHRFVLTGFRSDVDRLLPSFDLFALSSFTEGLPNVVLEAMAAQLPVVATAVGGTGEVVVDGRTGQLVAPGDADTLAIRLLELVGSETKRRMMGIAGRQRVVEEFSFEQQARQYCALFQSLTGKSIKQRTAVQQLQAS